jgi:protein KRI1
MKELQELNQIRKREIEEKLLMLKNASGQEDLPLQQDDLDSDFDPDEHDRRMAKLFDQNYYGVDEGEQKPEFPEIDEEIGIENWDNFDKSKVDLDQNQEEEVHCEDDDFIMDADFDPNEAKKKKLQDELLTITKGRKRRRKLNRLAQLLKQEKPVYTPELNKTYDEYVEEYYKLDYEDVIGDQPCRFKYSECVPNDFGLTVEEVSCFTL